MLQRGLPDGCFHLAISAGLEGRLAVENPCLRAAFWRRIWLHMPAEDVLQRYRHLKAPSNVMDLVERSKDPLSLEGGSAWSSLRELSSIIRSDLDRIYFKGPLDFRDDKIQGSMLRCLMTYAVSHGALTYRQGFHELLAHIYSVLEQEMGWHSSGSSDADLLEILEAEAYGIFQGLMEALAPLYEQRVCADDAIVELCRRMQGTSLAAVDPELSSHLELLCVTPQMYGIRWCRLMFCRETAGFNITLRIWDFLFATAFARRGDSIQESLICAIEYVGVSLLSMYRSSLLSCNCSSVLPIIAKPFEISDVDTLLATARVYMPPPMSIYTAAATAAKDARVPVAGSEPISASDLLTGLPPDFDSDALETAKATLLPKSPRPIDEGGSPSPVLLNFDPLPPLLPATVPTLTQRLEYVSTRLRLAASSLYHVDHSGEFALSQVMSGIEAAAEDLDGIIASLAPPRDEPSLGAIANPTAAIAYNFPPPSLLK
jgi:hypothetical protein